MRTDFRLKLAAKMVGALATWLIQRLGRLLTQNVFLGRRPDPFGGNVVIETTAELLFPMPFIEDRRSVDRQSLSMRVTFLIPTVAPINLIALV